MMLSKLLLASLLMGYTSSASAALIGHWKFDESSGSSALDSVGGNDGSWVPGSDATPDWKPANGLFGGAIEFPGTGNHVNYFTIGGFPQLNGTPAGMTISAWVFVASDSGYRGILMSRAVSDTVGGGASGQNYGLAHDDNGADGRVSGSSVDSAANSLVANGEWRHVVWVWDNAAGTQRIFLNGAQSGPTSSGGGMPAGLGITANGEWRIGDDDCCTDRTFDGLIDDLAVWNEPLSAAQISTIHANGIAGMGIADQPPPLALNAGLVINEIHYDAEPKTEFVEFIELLNSGPDPVDLSGWSFTDGVTFAFPAGTTLGVNEFLLLSENPASLAGKFPAIPAGTPVRSYAGALSNNGEKLELQDALGMVVDLVNYRAEFPWPISPNGEGNSMQLINATLDNNLGGAWRGAPPTPGHPNSPLTLDAPPLIRHVDHTPNLPLSTSAVTVSAKVTDLDGVASVNLLYQIVAPGDFIPAFLPNVYSTLTGNPAAPPQPNPDFENPANWTSVAMADDGTGTDTYRAQVPAQENRTLIRYRIEASDSLGNGLRVPYPDDRSLNFACFVYDGVPAWSASTNSVHPDGPGHSYRADLLTALPVYSMITRDSDRAYAFAYSSTGHGGLQIPKGNVAARQVYNWECALVYDGVVYDHVGWRLRQRNDRYAGNGKRSLRFRLNRGHYFQARDESGKKLPVKWRRFNTSKMSRFGGTNSFGFYETMNSKLWRMVGVECPYFLPAHFRMIDGPDEAPDQYGGDFFGLTTIVQDIDGRLLDERKLPNGNMYKLKDGVTDPIELQRNQSRFAVTDGSDFLTIKNDLNATQSDSWLRDHVHWDQWARYHAVVEAVRHYDYGTPSTHFKNRAWFFQEQAGIPHGLLRIIPHDHDASWSPGYHDSLNNVGNSIGTGFPWAAIFGDIRRPPSGIARTAFTRDYRNFIREFRDLLWQEETVHAMIDDHVALLREFSLADRDRWTGAPTAAGSENMVPIENIATPMKNMAFVSDTMYGANLPGGRGAFLDQIAADPAIPDTPTISYLGPASLPVGSLEFSSSSFSDPQGAGTFGKMEWRIGEITDPSGAGPTTSFVASGAPWNYFELGTDPGATWNEATYDDSAWPSGATQIGYGEDDENTSIAGGHPTTYFRKVVTVPDPTLFSSFEGRIIRDDGAIVYLNGTEVWRNQMPDGPVDHSTTASDRAAGSNETEFQIFSIPASLFVAGDNLIAVEMHQIPANSADMSFDFELDGLAAHQFEWNATWESGELTTFQSSIVAPAFATRSGRYYRARVRHADSSGRWSHWSAPYEFSPTLPDLSPFINSIVISEIDYHPATPTPAEIAAGYDDDDFFEYIEIRNVGPLPVELDNLRFTKGIDINLAGTLPPGDSALVVNHLPAFELRHGTGLPVIGSWSGKLDNGGERVKLSFGAGLPIRDFVYDDMSPWPTSPDGTGFSLVLVDPFGLPDHADPFNWRASVAAGGTPGSSDSTAFTGSTSEDLLNYALGPQRSLSRLPDGNLAFQVELNQLAEDIASQIETSSNLLDWQPAGVLFQKTAVQPTTAGHALVTFVSTAPPGSDRWFIRLMIQRR